MQLAPGSEGADFSDKLMGFATIRKTHDEIFTTVAFPDEITRRKIQTFEVREIA